MKTGWKSVVLNMMKPSSVSLSCVSCSICASKKFRKSLPVSTAKPKLLIEGRGADAQAALCVWKQCQRPEYLGRIVTADNTLHAEVCHRFASAGYVWHQLNVARGGCGKHLTRAREVLPLNFVAMTFL